MKKSTYILKENCTGKEIPEFHTSVEITKTDTDLIFEFNAKNTQFYSHDEGYNTEVFCGDACEAFICTDGSRVNYFELEVAPNGSVFCAKIYNPDGNFQVSLIEKNPVTSYVEHKGNDLFVRFSIPLDYIGYKEEVGLLLNAFRIETEGGIRDKNLLSLSPTLTNTFHRPEFFIEF